MALPLSDVTYAELDLFERSHDVISCLSFLFEDSAVNKKGFSEFDTGSHAPFVAISRVSCRELICGSLLKFWYNMDGIEVGIKVGISSEMSE